MNVVVTGCRGKVGQLLLTRLDPTFQVSCIDREREHAERRATHRAVDLMDADHLRSSLEGAEAVVHLAAESSVDASWAALREPNVQGVVNLFEAALAEGVGRIVLASSAHVSGTSAVPPGELVDPLDPPRPDSLYAVSKVFAESLGRYYSDHHEMRVVCLRLGWVLEHPVAAARRSWLSPDDLVRLFGAALTAEVRFGIYFGVSDNSARPWSIDNAREDLGYVPLDRAEDHLTVASA